MIVGDRLARIERGVGVLEDRLDAARASRRGRIAAIGSPSSRISPRVGGSRPSSMRASVVLPQPISPTMAEHLAALHAAAIDVAHRGSSRGANKRAVRHVKSRVTSRSFEDDLGSSRCGLQRRRRTQRSRDARRRAASRARSCRRMRHRRRRSGRGRRSRAARRSASARCRGWRRAARPARCAAAPGCSAAGRAYRDAAAA